jgi:hypothetical protein
MRSRSGEATAPIGKSEGLYVTGRLDGGRYLPLPTTGG